MKKTAVLLTVHNRKEKTLACLDALYACVLPIGHSIDVYLVDDGCTDGTSEAIRELFPRVNIIKGSGELFWNRGTYLAWQTAIQKLNYDYYMWLNDDTILLPHAIGELIECSEKEKDKVIVCGSTSAFEDKTQITYSGYIFEDNKKIVPNGQVQVCHYFNGNIVLIPRFVYAQIGVNDVYYRHSIGDFDYGVRATKKGIKSFVAPSVLGRCDGNKRPEKWSDEQISVFKRLQILYSPLGNNPFELFRYKRRSVGLIQASSVL
jgi:GT2 family glycosyltransferase